MSFLLNFGMLSKLLFKTYLDSSEDPIKKATNPIISVMVRLVEGEFMDNRRNNANRNSTIKGLKIWYFRMVLLFKKSKKFSFGYNFLK